MRVFVLLLIVGVAFAAPQGYNYQIQAGGNGIGNFALNQLQLLQQQQQYQQQSTSVPPASLQTQNTVQLQSQQKTAKVVPIQQQTLPFELTQTQPQVQHQSQHLVQQLQKPQYSSASLPSEVQSTNPTTVQYNKEIYYISAPAANYQLPANFQDQLNNIKKNIRVIFIKSPENNGLQNAVLQLSKEAESSKTAIYVLIKQHNAAELSKRLQQLPSRVQQKPEVVFVKYRTPAEAEHAQRTIQSQYDETLKGPSYVGFESFASTHDFIGSNAAIEAHAATADDNVAPEVSSVASPNYLPPAE